MCLFYDQYILACSFRGFRTECPIDFLVNMLCILKLLISIWNPDPLKTVVWNIWGSFKYHEQRFQDLITCPLLISVSLFYRWYMELFLWIIWIKRKTNLDIGTWWSRKNNNPIQITSWRGCYNNSKYVDNLRVFSTCYFFMPSHLSLQCKYTCLP